MRERAGFESLFEAEYPRLVLELRLLLHDPALAEETAAEAFLAAWRSWDEVEGLDRPGAWVRKVALRHAGRARWRRGRRQQLETGHAPADGPHRDDALDPDLIAALHALSSAQRTAIVLHDVGGWSAAEIGHILDCAEPTVRSHLRRGRQRLAALLRPTDHPMEVSDG